MSKHYSIPVLVTVDFDAKTELTHDMANLIAAALMDATMDAAQITHPDTIMGRPVTKVLDVALCCLGALIEDKSCRITGIEVQEAEK